VPTREFKVNGGQKSVAHPIFSIRPSGDVGSLCKSSVFFIVIYHCGVFHIFTTHTIDSHAEVDDDPHTSLGEERDASFCRNSCDVGGIESNLSQPNGNLLLLGSSRG